MREQQHASARVQASRRSRDLIRQIRQGVGRIALLRSAHQVHLQTAESFGNTEGVLAADEADVDGVRRNRIARAEVRRRPTNIVGRALFRRVHGFLGVLVLIPVLPGRVLFEDV